MTVGLRRAEDAASLDNTMGGKDRMNASEDEGNESAVLFVGLRRGAALASVGSYCDLSKGNAADKRAGVRRNSLPSAP